MKSKVDKKAIIGSKRSEQLQCQAIQECDKDAVIQKLEEFEGNRELVRSISEAHDAEAEHGTQCFKAELHESSGLDEGQIKESDGWLKPAEKKGGRKCKSKPQVWSKARECVSEKRNSRRRRERRRAGGDGWICRSDNRKRKCRFRPRRDERC